jgi:exodeoxyribonuclease V alpha subunit
MTAVEVTLASMLRASVISDLDLFFAQFALRHDRSGGLPLAVSAALLSALTSQGQTSIPVDELCSRASLWLPPDSTFGIASTLEASPLVGAGFPATPIVIDQNRVYLYRYWGFECRLVEVLKRRNRAISGPTDDAWLTAALERLFPDEGVAGVDWQKLATALAMVRQLVIISGGPGTGKTSTMVRLLALILEQAGEAGCRIALTAPTGKAAARMQQAIALARGRLPVAREVIDAIPETASTIHRLLGARSRGGGFRHHGDNPLAIDLLVVDEVSMVDLALMTCLLEAVPSSARIILMGDRHQLASVGPGGVFADLCRGADQFTVPVASRLASLAGYQPETTSPAILADASVELKKSYRFGVDSGIARLAEAVREGGQARVMAVLEGGHGEDDVAWRRPASGNGFDRLVREHVVSVCRSRLESVRRGPAPSELFGLYAGSQMLCAVRAGEAGVAAMNFSIERTLAQAGLIDPTDPWYPGRPLLITANDYSLNLFNGDIGLILIDAPSGAARACFMSEGGEVRWMHPARLPPHETAWALTIHKSQGSEFNEVIVVLPPEDTPLLTRELLYTAITRARQRVEIWASPEIVSACVLRRTYRESGLLRRLSEPDDTPQA